MAKAKTKTVKMLYVGKDSGELKRNTVIDVELLEQGDDFVVPASLVGRVKETGEQPKSDDSKKELAAANKKIAELEKANADLTAKFAELEKK
jgi:hypothetical protein